MTAEHRVFQAMMANQTLTALIGDRLYPLLLPQRCPFPAAVYQRISSPRIHSLAGQSGLAQVRVQVAAWAKTYPEVKAVAEAMRLALAKNLPEGQISGDRDRYEAKTELFGVDFDVSFFHTEPKY